MAFAMICSLAFVPPEDVESAYLELVPTLPADLLAVSNHIDWYYIRGNPIRNANRGGPVRSPPLFRINEWNHHQSIKDGDNKTNNVLEGWNHRIQHVVGQANPSFARFIKCLKMEQKNSEHRIGLALSGKIKGNVTQKAESRQRALKTLIDDYANRDILDFLRGVSHNIEISEMADPGDEDED